MDKAYGNILEVARLNSLILRFDVGGEFIWYNLWCKDSLLKEALPELFWIAHNIDATVGECINWSNDIIHWNLSF